MIYLDNNSENIIFPNNMGLEVKRARGLVTNNVTNEKLFGYGVNSSVNPLYLNFVFAEGWLQQFPDNEYTVELEAYDTINDEWIFIGKYLVQKGIKTTKDSSVFEDEVNYIQFE